MHVLSYESGAKPVKVDVKDKRILLCLARNARIAHAAVAREVGLSPDAVRARIARMHRENILLGSRTILAANSSFHLFFSGVVDEKTLHFLLKHERIAAVLQHIGGYEYEIACSMTSRELDLLRLELAKRMTIRHQRTVELIGTIKAGALPAGLFADLHSKDAPSLPPATGEADEIDKQLLQVLANNADMDIAQLATASNLTRDQVAYRMRRMQRDCVIRGFTPVINYAALGFSIHVLLVRLQHRDEKKEKVLEAYLREQPNILWAAHALGSWDLVIYTITKTNTDLHAALLALREHFADLIGDTELLLAFREHKYTYAPML